MLESSRTGQSNIDVLNTGRKNRYEDSEPSIKQSNRNLDDLQSIDDFEEQIEVEELKL